jgi:hypothetical protein
LGGTRKAEVTINLKTEGLNSGKVLDNLSSHVLPHGVKVEQYRKDPHASLTKSGRASLKYSDSDSDVVFQITRRGYVRFYATKLEADKIEEKLVTALMMLNGGPFTVGREGTSASCESF